MARIFLIRHGQAAAGWGEDADPGLSGLGQSQAETLVRVLADHISKPVPILTSPLGRCQQTAAPLAEAWGIAPRVDERLRELPSPTKDLAQRTHWLKRVMAGSWPELERDPSSAGVDFAAWRGGLADIVREQSGLTDVVMVSHFIAINVLHGMALGHERVVGFRPDNCSVTIFSTHGERLLCETQGQEAETVIN